VNPSDGGRSPSDRRIERVRPWAPFLVAATAVLVASVVPVPAVTAGGGGSGFLSALGPTGAFHLVGYAALAALAYRATTRDRGGRERAIPSRSVAVAVAVAAATGFGFGVELVQAPIPWRSFAWMDAAVNGAGAGTGALLAAGVDADRSAEPRSRPR